MLRQWRHSPAFAVALALGAASSGAALSAEAEFTSRHHEPMSFALGRHPGSPDCGPRCAEFIVAAGEIRGFEYLKLLVAWTRAGSRPIPIVLHSPGGNIDTASAMGDIFARFSMTVVIAKATPTRCRKTSPCAEAEVKPYALSASKAGCASACALAIAGAARRVVPPGAGIGVHMPSLDAKANPFAEDGEISRLAKEAAFDMLAGYYAKRGIAPEILAFVKSAGPDSMRWLTPEEMRRVGLIDGSDQALPKPPPDRRSSAAGAGSTERQRP